MIPDIKVPVGAWQDLYSLIDAQATSAGFPVIARGTRLSLQNKGGGDCMVWEGLGAPPTFGGDNLHGYLILQYGQQDKTDPNPAGVWVYYRDLGVSQTGRLCVQEYMP